MGSLVQAGGIVIAERQASPSKQHPLLVGGQAQIVLGQLAETAGHAQLRQGQAHGHPRGHDHVEGRGKIAQQIGEPIGDKRRIVDRVHVFQHERTVRPVGGKHLEQAGERVMDLPRVGPVDILGAEGNIECGVGLFQRRCGHGPEAQRIGVVLIE